MINALNKILSPIKPYGTLIIFPTLAGLGAWILYDTHSRIMSPSQFDMSIWDTIELYIALTLTAALLLAMLRGASCQGAREVSSVPHVGMPAKLRGG